MMQADPLSEVACGICRHPRFDHAVAYYVEQKLQLRREIGLLNQIIPSVCASQIMTFVVLLHLERNPEVPGSGASLTRLLAMCEARQLCGARALRTLLAYAEGTGMVERIRNSSDKRVHDLVPTQKLFELSRALVSYTIGAFDVMLGGDAFRTLPYRDADFISHLVRTAIRQYVDQNILVTEYSPPIHELLMQKGGASTLAALVEAQMNGHKFPSTHHIARNFRFSPTQVRKILKLANQHELITLSRQGQVMEAAALADSYKRYFARELALYAKYTLGLEATFVPLAQDGAHALSSDAIGQPHGAGASRQQTTG